jgi:protein-S-isoprenylcysteine O-methyltransferase Ste14
MRAGHAPLRRSGVAAGAKARPSSPRSAAATFGHNLHAVMDTVDVQVRQGQWLFRNRSWIPALPLAGLLLSVPFASRSLGGHGVRGWELFCVAISLSGLLLRAFVIGSKPRRTSGRNRRVQVAETLNTTGLYSVVRHPLYLGNALMWTGLALFPRIWLAAAFSAVFFTLFYGRVMAAEEDFLRSRFGAEYEAWATDTPRLLPAFWRWRPTSLPFSLKAVLKAEYPGFLALTLLFYTLRSELDLVHLHRIIVRPFWLAFALTGVGTYLVLRTLRKHTTVLHTTGR